MPDYRMSVDYMHDDPPGKWVCKCEGCSDAVSLMGPTNHYFVIRFTNGVRLIAHALLVLKINEFVRERPYDLDVMGEAISEIFVGPVSTNPPFVSPDNPLAWFEIHPEHDYSLERDMRNTMLELVL